MVFTIRSSTVWSRNSRIVHHIFISPQHDLYKMQMIKFSLLDRFLPGKKSRVVS